MFESIIVFLQKHLFKTIFFCVSLLGSLISLVKLGVPIADTLLIFFGGIILFLIGALAKLLVDQKNTKADVLLFHLILPTDGIKPFYNILINSASKCLESLSDRNWLLCPRIPTSSFDKLDIWQKYDRLAAIRRTAGGVFLLADDPDANFDKIIDSVKSNGIPVVMIDVYFDPAAYDDRNKAKMPCFVGGDENLGGKIAAEIAVSHLKKICTNAEHDATVIIIRGGNTAWELQRVTAFKRLVSENIKVTFSETDFLFYNRSDAYDEVYRLFCGELASKLNGCLAIFAANDDMAIGARNALRDVSRLRDTVLDVAIIGYDGAPEMKSLIDRHDEHLIGTVDVRIEEQAKRAVALMKDIVEGKVPKEKINLVSPRMYVRPN